LDGTEGARIWNREGILAHVLIACCDGLKGLWSPAEPFTVSRVLSLDPWIWLGC